MRSVIVLLVALAAIAYPIGRELLQSSSGSSSSGSDSSGSSSSGSSSSGSSSSGSSSSGSSSSGSSSSGSSSSGSSSSGSSDSSSTDAPDLCSRDALLKLEKAQEQKEWSKTCCVDGKYTKKEHEKYCKDNKGKVKSDDGKKDLNDKKCKALYTESICKEDKEDEADVCEKECVLGCFNDKKDGDVAKWQKKCCNDEGYTKKDNKEACAKLGGGDDKVKKCEDRYDKVDDDKAICPKTPCDPNKCTLACFTADTVAKWDIKCCAAGGKCEGADCFEEKDNKKECEALGGGDDKVKKCEAEYKKTICK